MKSRDAGEQVLHLMAENERLRAALKELDTLFEFGAGTFSCACFPLGKQEHLQAAFKQAHAAIEASDEQSKETTNG